MSNPRATVMVTLGCCLVLAGIGLGADSSTADRRSAVATDAGDRPVVILDTYGFWRMHHTLEPPVVDDKGKLTPITFGYRWIDIPTAGPPEKWPSLEFDDSSWLRGPARMSCRTPYLSRLCMRGYFRVADPSRVKDLTLTLLYHGGAVVYLNGQQVARSHVASGHSLAETYPLDAFVDAKGNLLRGWDKTEKSTDADTRRRVALRTRTMKDIRVPSEHLRPGTNVLAIEIVRAVYPPIVDTGKRMPRFASLKSDRRICRMEFNTCQLTGVQLKASSGVGVETGAVRAPGLHVWNSDVPGADFNLDFGGQAGEPLRPVRIVAARNGAFNGKFVVGSTDPLRKLKVTVGELSTGDGRTIDASTVEVRYGRAWGSESGAYGGYYVSYDKSIDGTLVYRYLRQPQLLGALWDAPPEEIGVSTGRRSRRQSPEDPRLPPSPESVPGAVVPVWLTVSVPRSAAPGRYVGSATVRAEGTPSANVPIQVEVADWTLPDTDNFTAWVDMIQSPDTLALEYDVPLWSQRHWELIARSMKLLKGVGNQVLYVPLIAETNLGNAESMVRWIDRGNRRYGYDLSVLDKYLDHCLKHMGRPSIVVLYVWDIYFAAYKQLKPLNDELELSRKVNDAKEAYRGKGPVVTFVDPATGTTEARHLPLLTDPESEGLWKGLLAEVRRRIEQKGLWDRVMLGTMSDAWPTKSEIDFYTAVAGNMRWFSDSHPGVDRLTQSMKVLASGRASRFQRERVYPNVKNASDEVAVLSKVGYSARVWSNVFGEQTPTGDSRRGWNRPELYIMHDRHADRHPMARWRLLPEENIIGEQRGIGRLGGDWWKCVRGRGGRRVGLARGRYPQSTWRNLDMNIQTMAPGPNGAVATHRFENIREGVQACEARIAVERALGDPERRKGLGQELARKAEELLRRRASLLTKASSSLQLGGPDHYYILNSRGFFQWPNLAGHCWYLSSDWQQADLELFNMAGAVSRRLNRQRPAASR